MNNANVLCAVFSCIFFDTRSTPFRNPIIIYKILSRLLYMLMQLKKIFPRKEEYSRTYMFL